MSETPEYRPEQKFGKFESEYRDAKGNVLCVAKFEIVSDPSTNNSNPILKSLKLEATDKSGQRKDVDILAMANPHGFKINMIRGDGMCLSPFKTITAPPPQNQLDLAVLLHELGHGDQTFEKKYQELDTVAIRQEQLKSCLLYPDKPLIELLNSIAQLIPIGKEMLDKIPADTLRWLETVLKTEIKALDDETIQHSNTYHKLYEEYKALNQQLAESDPDEEQELIDNLIKRLEEKEQEMMEIEQQDEETERKRKKIEAKIKEIIKQYQIAEILSLPIKLIEQDATRRAMNWLLQIKESGIDLFPELLAETKTLRGREHEPNSHTRTSIAERMYEWLKSYEPQNPDDPTTIEINGEK